MEPEGILNGWKITILRMRAMPTAKRTVLARSQASSAAVIFAAGALTSSPSALALPFSFCPRLFSENAMTCLRLLAPAPILQESYIARASIITIACAIGGSSVMVR